MAGIDLDVLGATIEDDTSATVWSEVQVENIETPYAWPWIDLDRLGATVEAHQEQWDLRTEIEQTTSPEFSTASMEIFQEFMSEYPEEIDGVIWQIETALQEASEMTLEELSNIHEGITLSWDFSEVWTQIESDVNRILWLEEWQEISILRDEWEVIFESKEDALRYLYYEKISFKYVYDFLLTLEVENEDWEPIPFLESTQYQVMKYALLSSIIAWIAFSTAGSIRRWIKQIWYRTFQTGQRITAIQRPDWAGAEDYKKLMWEHTEYLQRREAIDLAKEVFQGNERVSNSIWRSLFELFIDARIEDVRWWRIQEQSFWRNIYNITHQRGIIWQWFDTFLKPYYFNTRETVLEDLRNAARIRQETLDYFTNGNWNSEFESMRAFMELDHDVPNSRELEIRDRFNAVKRNLLWGNLDFLFWMNIDQAKDEIRIRIAEPIIWSQNKRETLRRVNAIIWDGTDSNPWEWGRLIRSEVTRYPFLTDINSYEQSIIARNLEARMNGDPYHPERVRWQLVSFFSSIGWEGTQNRYTYYSAASVIEDILSWMTKQEAIAHSEREPGDSLRSRMNATWENIATDYLANINSAHREQVRQNIIQRAESITSIEELNRFQIEVLDYIRGSDDRFREWFEDIGRRVERIVEQKQNEINLQGSSTEVDDRSPISWWENERWTPSEEARTTPTSTIEREDIDIRSQTFDYLRRVEMELRMRDISGFNISHYMNRALRAESLDIFIMEVQPILAERFWWEIEVRDWDELVRDSRFDLDRLRRNYFITPELGEEISTIRALTGDIEIETRTRFSDLIIRALRTGW